MAKNDNTGNGKPPAPEDQSPEAQEQRRLAAAAEETRLADEAKDASRKLAAAAGPGNAVVPPLTPLGIIEEGEDTVLCSFPKRCPLALSHHQRVEFPPGVYPVPTRLAVDWPIVNPVTKAVTKGMHPYMAAHGVTIAGK